MNDILEYCYFQARRARRRRRRESGIEIGVAFGPPAGITDCEDVTL
jgi:hypothetical protein